MRSSATRRRSATSSEMSEGALRGIESQWHKIYIGWHSILGQLKVKQHAEEAKSFFGGKK